jgi:hypothetical protein
MSGMLDIQESQRRAEAKLGRASRRRRRADAGRSRLPEPVLAVVRRAALGSRRPGMITLRERVAHVCAASGLKPPARATLYNAFDRLEPRRYRASTLPPHALDALYNLAPDAVIPGPQLAFYCFNYGSLAAVSFAAGLPWLDLYQARRLRGWRPRSRGLFDAVMRARGLS